MIVNFTKMHSLGNDFIILDSINDNLHLNTAVIKRMADRHLGIGCDQVVLLEPPYNPETDMYIHFYNADGKEAEHCGNGFRCAARFALDNRLLFNSDITAESLAGIVKLNVQNTNMVSIDMGALNPEILKETGPHVTKFGIDALYKVDIGNPHGICITDEINKIDIASVGADLSKLDCFPNEANITFMQLINNNEVNLRTFERGSGQTFACGTATVAAYLTAEKLNLCINNVVANYKLGKLNLLRNKSKSIIVEGPTQTTFNGSFRL